MTTPIGVTDLLAEWAALAGFALTPGFSTDDGRPMLWSAGGEVRYFIGRSDDGWFIITDSDRLGPEHFVLAAASMHAVERYLLGKFGSLIRSQRNLPRIDMPIAAERASAGYTVELGVFENKERSILRDPEGRPTAVGSGDPLVGTMQLVGLSLYLTATVDEITSAFLNADGSPLFSLR